MSDFYMDKFFDELEKNKDVRREKFEKWVSSRKVVKRYGANLKLNPNGQYADYRINDRWLAWNAALDEFNVSEDK